MGIFNASDFKRLVPLPWETDQDQTDILNRLRTGRVSAIVFDVLFVESVVSSMCEFIAVGDVIAPSPMGWVFPPSAKDSYILQFDSALQQLSQHGYVQKLADKFIFGGGGDTSQCDMTGLKFTSQTKLGDVGGLWVVLASCLGLALIVTGVQKILRASSVAQSGDKHSDQRDGHDPGQRQSSSLTLESALDRLKDMKRIVDQLPFEFDSKMETKIKEFKSKLASTVLNDKDKKDKRSPGRNHVGLAKAKSDAANIRPLDLHGSAAVIESGPEDD